MVQRIFINTAMKILGAEMCVHIFNYRPRINSVFITVTKRLSFSGFGFICPNSLPKIFLPLDTSKNMLLFCGFLIHMHNHTNCPHLKLSSKRRKSQHLNFHVLEPTLFQCLMHRAVLNGCPVLMFVLGLSQVFGL